MKNKASKKHIRQQDPSIPLSPVAAIYKYLTGEDLKPGMQVKRQYESWLDEHSGEYDANGNHEDSEFYYVPSDD